MGGVIMPTVLYPFVAHLPDGGRITGEQPVDLADTARIVEEAHRLGRQRGIPAAQIVNVVMSALEQRLRPAIESVLPPPRPQRKRVLREAGAIVGVEEFPPDPPRAVTADSIARAVTRASIGDALAALAGEEADK